MVWQSWGHSGDAPAPGELDLDAPSIDDTYLGRRFHAWMDHYVRGDVTAPVGPRFAYFRDWVRYDTSAANAGRAIDKAYAEKKSFSQAPTATLFLTGSDGLTPDRSKVVEGSASYANAPGAPTSYSETSGLEGGQVNQPVSDADGTFAAFTSAPLATGVAMVGSPRLTLHLDAPVAAGSQDSDPGGKLVLFAKIYDIAEDGTATLQHRLISPVRVADVTKPVTVELPGVVQRFKQGPPDPGGRGGQRLGLRRQRADAAGHGAHVPGRAEPAAAAADRRPAVLTPVGGRGLRPRRPSPPARCRAPRRRSRWSSRPG